MQGDLQELIEEHGNEDGLLSYALSPKTGNVTKTDLKNRLKEIRDDPDEAEELALLQQVQALMDQESDLKKQHKAAEKDLSIAVIETYPKLNPTQVRRLMIEDKWLARIESKIMDELNRVSQALTSRIQALAKRYATPLPELERQSGGT